MQNDRFSWQLKFCSRLIPYFFLFPILLFSDTVSDLNLGLRALRQIRDFIPERLSEEEFAIVIDRKGFDEALDRYGASFPAFSYSQSSCDSRFYYSQWTFSGEAIRILDTYEEFEYGPYWLYPTALHRLEDMYPPHTNELKNREITASALEKDSASENLQGILLLGNWDQVKKEPASFEGVKTRGLLLLSKYPKFLQRLQSEYMGQPLTQNMMENLRSEIVSFYCEKGQPFALVWIPRQNLSSGVLQVVIKEAVLNSINVQGNQSFSPDQIKNIFRAKVGEPINGLELVQDLARVNQNPFRRTDAILRPGKEPGTVDMNLATIDRFPYRFYMGADNTGAYQVDRDRFFFGLNLSKTIIDDSEFSYQFTCAPNWNRFYSQTANLRVPFPARQFLILYGGFAQTEPELQEGTGEKSQAWQVDGRYRFPFIINTHLLQEWILGYDFKQISGKIYSHTGEQVFHNHADISQFMLGYDLGHEGVAHKLNLVGELYVSPGGMSQGDTTARYTAFRPLSGPQYVYFKLSQSFAYKFNHFWLSYNLNGQVASKNLLQPEQFTLTGYNAVRGFEEQIVNVDDALLFNLTLQTPRFSIAKLTGWSRRSFDEGYFFVFFDCGYGGYVRNAGTQNQTVSLGSIGPGFRYQIDRYVSFRFDYGVQLWHRGFTNPSNSRYNFGLIVSL